jgi:hypothetical protein
MDFVLTATRRITLELEMPAAGAAGILLLSQSSDEQQTRHFRSSSMQSLIVLPSSDIFG